MPRNSRGFLKPDALAQGIRDQYAVMKDLARHEVSLFYSSRRDCYVVRYAVLDPSREIDEATEWEYAPDLLRQARMKFRRRVQLLGGRA